MKTYIIAEAGTGHVSRETEDRSDRAAEFIYHAARAGADAVKFQMFVRDEPLFCPLTGDDDRMLRWNLTALDLDHWRRLQIYADQWGIDLLWSVFQPTAVEMLKSLKPRYVKVASRAAQSFPYDALPGAKFIVSTGMGQPNRHDNFILKCRSEYPTPLEKTGPFIDGDFYHGLSDHSGTIWPGLDAIAHGARFLEVHFKIPGADMGNDEPVCLTTDQLKLLCEARDAFARMHAA